MLIASPWTGEDPTYERMSRVVEWSARRHNPDAEILVHNVDPRPTSRSGDAFVRKALAWTSTIQAADDGTDLVLLDTDTIVLGELASAFEVEAAHGGPFDVAVTSRGGLSGLNSGVLFVRVSSRTRHFFRDWSERTMEWCRCNRPPEPRFGDQDALRDMLAAPHGIAVAWLGCARWNAEQHCWPPRADCRIVHVKSDARRLLFGGRIHGNPGAQVVADMWIAAEAAVLAGLVAERWPDGEEIDG